VDKFEVMIFTFLANFIAIFVLAADIPYRRTVLSSLKDYNELICIFRDLLKQDFGS
jgi:hypothetical protein